MRTSARGASLVEYAFLLVTILLVAAGAFRALGRATRTSTLHVIAVLDGGEGGGTGGTGVGSAGGAPLPGIGSLASQVARGAVTGGGSGSAAALGSMLGAAVPGVGQVTSMQSVASAVQGMGEGRPGAAGEVATAAMGAFGPTGAATAQIVRDGESAADTARNEQKFQKLLERDPTPYGYWKAGADTPKGLAFTEDGKALTYVCTGSCKLDVKALQSVMPPSERFEKNLRDITQAIARAGSDANVQLKFRPNGDVDGTVTGTYGRDSDDPFQSGRAYNAKTGAVDSTQSGYLTGGMNGYSQQRYEPGPDEFP